MGPYRSLFSVAVEHGFFSDELWRGLRFVPAAAAQSLINSAGMVMRKTVNGFALYYDQSRLEAMALLLADSAGEFSFGFKVFVDDDAFPIYSEPYSDSSDSVPYFDSEQGVADGERIRLHAERQVSDRDMQPLGSGALAALLGSSDWLVRPAFAFRILFRPAANSTLQDALEDESPNYFIRFGARQTYWTYYLLGAFAGMRVGIVDLDEGVGFEPLDRVSLADKRTALAFRSKAEIPLRQHSACRFQLREIGAERSRVLVRRLPVAAVKQLSRQSINGKVASVSEIYVNG